MLGVLLEWREAGRLRPTPGKLKLLEVANIYQAFITIVTIIIIVIIF